MAAVLNPSNFNALPGSTHGLLSGEDAVPFNVDLEREQLNQNTPVGLLTAKFEHALANLGYDRDTQSKVSKLVSKNVATRDVDLGALYSGDNASEQDLAESFLRTLLSSGVNVNSNEPVLLLVARGEHKSAETLASLRDHIGTTLRNIFNVFPVRVYMAQSTQRELVSSEQTATALSVAVLNVVNTDIGGPSMIQLLDSHPANSEWEESITFAEAWNRADLLWRDERSRDSYSNPTKTPEVEDLRPIASGETEFAPQESVPLGQIPHASEDQRSDSIPDEPETNESSETGSPQRAEHPALTELREREANRPSIQHPTWDHARGNESLVDIIRRQASGVVDKNDDDGELVDTNGENALFRSSTKSDDFELV